MSLNSYLPYLYVLNIAHMSNNDQIKNKYTSYKMALIFCMIIRVTFVGACFNVIT